MDQLNWRHKGFAVFLFLAATAVPSSAQTFSNVVIFNGTNGDDPNPGSPLVQGTDGNLYGTTVTGGAYNGGTVFKATLGGALTTLYSFGASGNANDPREPSGGVIQATDGNFYGTTRLGGANLAGTVFKITPGGALTALYSFGNASTDGSQPRGALLQATDGNFYGMTAGTPPTVFKITPAGTLTTIYSGAGIASAGDNDRLIQATDSNFYGTTENTVFKITPSGTLTTLSSFSLVGTGNVGLVQASDGSLYGTTKNDGAGNYGTVFKISPGGTLTTLYTFGGEPNFIGEPLTGLTLGSDGNFYGITGSGGTNEHGTIFKVTPGGALAALYNFGNTASDGNLPYGLVQATDGNLYGTTQGGAAGGVGSIFQLTLPAAPLPAPSITAGGIVPVYSSSNTIQPGEWLSIYGTNLASTSATWTGNFPTSLGGTSVTIDGKPAYLWVVSPTQINLQSPDDTATGTVPVVVKTASGSATSTATLAQFAPSFLLLDARHVTGIILRSNGSGAYGGGSYDIIGPTGTSLGYPTVAAKAGDVVELFAVGFGPTSPAVPAGQAFSSSAATTNAVGLLINNVGVTPSFAGLSGAGLYQINLTVPPGLGTGDVPLVGTVGGVQTQTGVVISLQ